MRILYDHQMFSNQRFGGITNYFCQLIKNIPEGHHYKLSLLVSYNEYLKENNSFFKKLFIPLPEKQFTGRRFLKNKIYILNKQFSKTAILSKKYDIFHPTFYDPYFLKNIKKPYIVTVHDLIPFKFKDKFNWKDLERQQMEIVIKNADRIISISHNTKEDLIDILNVHPDKIDVIYHGFNHPEKNNKPNLYGKYILFVGQRDGYKNFNNFLNAISPLLKQDTSLNLVCVGKPFTPKERYEISKLNVLNKIISLSTDEKGLQNLYANALVFVYPSLYEGFGMPILEAFANNCPVCLSNTSSFPEIAGNAAIYFNPYDNESIFEAIEKILFNKTLKDQLISLGQKRLSCFSWKRTASETIKSYEKILGN